MNTAKGRVMVPIAFELLTDMVRENYSVRHGVKCNFGIHKDAVLVGTFTDGSHCAYLVFEHERYKVAKPTKNLPYPIITPKFSSHSEGAIAEALRDMWELLDKILGMNGDTIWANEHETAHEGLCDIAEKYDREVAQEFQRRMET